MEMKDDASINNLSKTSWFMIASAMLVDASTWAFPSYNIVIGVFAKIVVFNASSQVPNREKNLILLTSIFSMTTVMSNIFDAIYCICWGGEIFVGDSKSAKFAIVFFIINIFVKLLALIYSTIIQINASEEFQSLKSKQSGNGNDGVEMERKVASLGEIDIDDDHHKKSEEENSQGVPSNCMSQRDDINIDAPLPPSTPGIPGLVSPYPRVTNYGVTPPRPPKF
jgi:hypothetical protein